MVDLNERVKPSNPLRQFVFRLRRRVGQLTGRARQRRAFGRGRQCENRQVFRKDSAGSEGPLTLGQFPLISIVFAAERRMFRHNQDGVTGGAAPKARRCGGLFPTFCHAALTGAEGARILSNVNVDMAEIEVDFASDGRVRHANEAACGVTYGLGDCLNGQHIYDLFGPRICDGAEIRKLWTQVLRGQCPQGRFQMHPGEDTARIVDGQFSAACGPDGRVQTIRFRGVEAAANDVGPVRALGKGASRRAMGS